MLPAETEIASALTNPNRMSVFAINDHTGQDDATFIGPQSPLAIVFGKIWAKELSTPPDNAYLAAVQSPYEEVRTNREPSADHVIAAIQTIHAPEPLWVPYARLLCPLSGAGDPVICATAILPGSASPIP
jgi:hypothetical protein